MKHIKATTRERPAMAQCDVNIFSKDKSLSDTQCLVSAVQRFVADLIDLSLIF